MRFLVDECTGPSVAQWLRELHHDVFSVYDKARGLDDESIIEKAYHGNYDNTTSNCFINIIFHYLREFNL